MLLYEKVPISDNSIYGIQEVKRDSIFKEGPCVIIMLSSTWFLSNINAAMRYVTNIVNEDIDNHYDPNKRVFGVAYGNYSEEYQGFTELVPTDEEIADFTSKYFFPLIEKNDNRISLVKALRNLRNINFITYCNGDKYFKKIESSLKMKMNELGYGEEEQSLLLSQISVASISGQEIPTKGTKATSLIFSDENDIYYVKPSEKIISCNNIHEINVSGDGDHGLKKYMVNDSIISNSINTFLTRVLDNSIFNYNNKDTFIPIQNEGIDKILIDQKSINDEKKKELRQN